MLRAAVARGTAASTFLAMNLMHSTLAEAQEKPKLTYFDLRGFAEQSRILMKIGGMDFIDNRIPFSRPVSPEFIEKKTSGAFDINMGRVPMLEGMVCYAQFDLERVKDS